MATATIDISINRSDGPLEVAHYEGVTLEQFPYGIVINLPDGGKRGFGWQIIEWFKAEPSA